jgi:pilus assembly protein FimV
MRKTMRISGLLLAMLFAMGGAEAAGLGRLSVQSALGQPLKAEIELLSVNKDELPSINARLAGADAFRQARIDRSEALASLRFSVDQRANGQPIIRVSSSVPIADPFLDLLIEVDWNSGRLLREYTVLLDPPAEARQVPTQPAALPEVARPVQPQPVAVPEHKAAVESAKPKAPEPAPARQPRRYGPVKSGETLRGIAGKVKQDSVTLEQMMVGLYQANQGAFYANNVNRLKRGQVLNVPDADTVNLQVSPAQAARTLHGQDAEWHAYRKKVAEMAEEAPAAKAPEPASGKVATKAEENAPAAAAAPKDVLKLSKGEPGGAGSPNGKTQEKLRALEEEIAAKGRALQEAQDRVGQLERTVRDMQKLLDLKTQAAKAPPAPAQPPAPAPAATPAPAQPPVAKAPEATPAPVAPPPPVVKHKPAPMVMPAPVQQSSTSWLSTFISSPLYIGGIVAAILLSVLLWMMMVGSRRRQGLTRFEDSIMTGGEFKNNVVFNATSPASSNASAGANTEGSMLLTDFSRLGLGAIDTHEVDPIAEAEVYMAYGRDAQAEEILKEALNKDPSRHEIALKLLEIYASRKDTLAFETVASELYAGLGGQGTPVWQRAAEMGRSIDVSNPLYRAISSDMPAVSTLASRASSRPAAPTPDPAAAARGDFSRDMGQADDWQASAPIHDADLDIPAPRPATPAASFAPGEETPGLAASATPAWQSPKQETFSASLPEEDFTLEFEPAAPAPASPAVVTPTAMDEDLGWYVPSAPVPEPAATPAPVTEAEPMFEAVAAGAAPSWQEPVADMEFEATPAFDEVPELAEEPGSVPVLDLSGIDLELEQEPAPAVEAEPLLEMPAPEMPAPVEAEPVLEAFAPADDFAPGMVEEFSPPAEAEPPAPQPVAEAMPAAPPADSELWEEVNTKLDLARAYLEMGDKEGAREILQEVQGEGDSQQKSDADKLLAEAG